MADSSELVEEVPDIVDEEPEELNIIPSKGGNGSESIGRVATTTVDETELEIIPTVTDHDIVKEPEVGDNDGVRIGNQGNDHHHDMDDDVSKMYLPEIAKPILKTGGTSISYAQAKLYGLLDKDGNIKTNKIKCTTVDDVTAKLDAKAKSRVMDISKPRPLPPQPKVEAAKFSKTKAAKQAMLDPGCGYDFVDKLETGNFLETLAAQEASRKSKGKATDHEKADYEAKLDKLSCPKCKREQSFDEFYEKRRTCTRCKERFRQIHVSSGGTYLKRTEEAQKKKEERLAKLEQSIYGNDGKPNISSRPKSNRKATTVSFQPKSDQGVMDKLAEDTKRQADITKKLFEKQYQNSELMFDSKLKQEQLVGKSSKK